VSHDDPNPDLPLWTPQADPAPDQSSAAIEIPWQIMWAMNVSFFFGLEKMQSTLVVSLLEKGLSEDQVVTLMAPVSSQARTTALWVCGLMAVAGAAIVKFASGPLLVTAPFLLAFSVWLVMRHVSRTKDRGEMGAKGAVKLLWKRAKGD
jgi:hypothetical protein